MVRDAWDAFVDALLALSPEEQRDVLEREKIMPKSETGDNRDFSD